ncbi:hypothetical protein [Hydrogenovibrio marinus]|uniref:WGR domain-containing protein n=1 Tax=Hydrogenovibrio marinus TaxID=28885 RepID=A0A066ZR44_HYDMR|nr:hypothetical protein [Hydrogenovibrio marinus]KDN94709.1 hypothetical protein EI16_12495 [Hydrogenovibrio marinus]
MNPQTQTSNLIEKANQAIQLDGQTKLASWVNAEKRRYYRLLLGMDLIGDIVLEREWGSLDSNLHGSKRQVIAQSAQENIGCVIAEICKTREHRGYEFADI